jgi:hypothetical protein
VKIHQIVDNATLKIVSNAANDDLLANIHDFQVGQVGLVAVGVNGAINLFVVADAITEVQSSRLGVLATVVWAGSLDIADVGHDEFFIVALALDEEHLDTFSIASLADPFPPLLGRVGGIEDTNNTASAEPSEHVGDGGLSSSSALALAFWVVGVEEVGCGLGSIVTPVVSDIEGLCRDGEPLEVSLGCRGEKMLAREDEGKCIWHKTD